MMDEWDDEKERKGVSMDRAEMRVKRIKIAGKKRRDDHMRKKKRIRIKKDRKKQLRRRSER